MELTRDPGTNQQHVPKCDVIKSSGLKQWREEQCDALC